MTIEFTTKKDVNGNRYYLSVDTDKKEFALNTRNWYNSDMVEISRKEYLKLTDKFRGAGFVEKDILGN